MWSRLYISPRGRCSRRFYWVFGVLPFVAIGVVLGFVSIWTRTNPPGLAYPIALLVLWPTLAMQIKRWHDIGRSGWMCLLSFIPIVGAVVMVVVGLVPGTVGTNRFGHDPLGARPVPASAL